MTLPPIVSATQLRDYLDWHVQNGRGSFPVAIDQRGLTYLEPKHHANLGVGLPPDGEMNSNGRVFLRAVF